MKRAAPQPVQGDVSSFVEDAFLDAETLRDELQNWLDSMPENLQNGTKADALNEAIGNIESAQQPDVPDSVSGDGVEYTPCAKRNPSRSDRLSECIARLQVCAEAARQMIETMNGYEYEDDEEEADSNSEETNERPTTEDDRDNIVNELEEFANELDDAVNNWECVEFPGMF